jgi:hypothetical protein
MVGMLAALLAAERHDHVVLVETSLNLGGLHASFRHEGAVYDHGTHIPAVSGNEEMDAILYGSVDEREKTFHFMPWLRSENYFGGRWYEHSPLLDARALPDQIYARGVVDLLEAPGPDPLTRNLEIYLQTTVGATFAKELYGPVIQKLTGVDTSALDIEILRTFGLQRIIALTPEVTRDLKKIRHYDLSLGYHSYTEGAPPRSYLYPKGEQGIGAWPNRLHRMLAEKRVQFFLGNRVSGIAQANGRISSVALDDGTVLDCNQLIWTVPTARALRAAGIPFQSAPPKFRTHTLCHFEFREPLLKTEPQYLLCWEPGRFSYRLTLYPNLTPDRRATRRHNLTVEVLGGAEARAQTEFIAAKVLEELRDMQIVSPENTLVASKAEYLGPSFPILTPDFLAATRTQSEVFEAGLKNAWLFGRGTGKAFFIYELLEQVFRRFRDA